MTMDWNFFWAWYRRCEPREKAAMDAQLKEKDLNAWIVSQSPDTIAEVIEHAPLNIMLCYLPLLPKKLARQVQQGRPPGEWKRMNEVYFSRGQGVINDRKSKR